MTDQNLPTSVSPISNAKRNVHFRHGALATAVYVIGLALYAGVQHRPMLKMTPDEFATFLSGVFAPLAFLWLVLGFRQQGDELQNSAKALWLQGEELRNSGEQQRQLVQVSRDQLEAEAENRRVEEALADRNAQPILTMPSPGGQYHGPARSISFHIHSAGPTCSDVRIFVNGVDEVVRCPVFQNGESIGFTMSYETPEAVEPFDVIIRYFDRRGRAKYQKFHVPASETGGPNRDRTLGEPFRPSMEAWDLTDV